MDDSNKPLLHIVRNLALLVAVILLSYLSLLYICETYPKRSNQYLAAQLDKIDLLEKTPSPRIILIGGSNLAFGIDSIKLSQAIKLPVVNMGLQGGLGLKYILDSINSLLKKDDVLVIVPEYEHFTGSTFYGDSTYLLDMFFITNDIRLLSQIKPEEFFKNSVIFDWTTRKPTAPYTRDGFDSRGDLIAHLTMSDVRFDHSELLDSSLNYRAMDYLSDFMHGCEIKGIKAVCVFPCLMRANYRINSSTISRIETALMQRIPNMAPASPTDFVYDDRYFFDTIYHLNAEGRRIRTEKMITVLDEWMKIVHESKRYQRYAPKQTSSPACRVNLSSRMP